MILVNSDYPYAADTEKNILVPISYRFPDIVMNPTAVNFLHTALVRISAGDAIVPVSAYRSLQEQTQIYNSSLKDNGEDFTKKYVALPNHSVYQVSGNNADGFIITVWR